MAGEDQCGGQQGDVVVGERGVLGLGCDEVGDDVPGWVRAFGVGQAVGVLDELGHGGLDDFCVVEDADPLGEFAEVGAVLGRDAE